MPTACGMRAQQRCYFFAILYGLASTLNGPANSSVAVKGPLEFLGSRHESEHVPPHPYSKLKSRLYEPSALRMRSLGGGGRRPLRVTVMPSPWLPLTAGLEKR